MLPAAARLRISQPSLSSQLKRLEGTLRVKLFRRVGRRNQLTDAGRVVFGFCRRMFEVSDELSEILLETIPSGSRRINLGATHEIDPGWATDWVSRYLDTSDAALRPKLSLTTAAHSSLIEGLRCRELDAIVTDRVISDPELRTLAHFESPVMLVASRAARLKTLATPATDWLLPAAGTKLRSEIEQYFEAQALSGRIVVESAHLGPLIAAAAAGVGSAFVPLAYLSTSARRHVQVRGPKRGFWRHRIWLASHRQNADDPLIQALAACLNQGRMPVKAKRGDR